MNVMWKYDPTEKMRAREHIILGDLHQSEWDTTNITWHVQHNHMIWQHSNSLIEATM